MSTPRWSATPWRVLAAGLALAGAGCLVVWADRSVPADPGAGARPTAAVASEADTADPSTDPPSRRPVRLRIPALDLTTRLTRLGLQADGTVEVPVDPAVAGWYRLGPAPGDRGSSVILGHVDSADGPAVFYRLSELDPGDRVRVLLDDGTTARFAVHAVTTYPNAEFPGRRVYAAAAGRQLNLVTCGGAYDAGRGGYQANVVVNARLVSGPA